jgi:hypothetical protein
LCCSDLAYTAEIEDAEVAGDAANTKQLRKSLCCTKILCCFNRACTAEIDAAEEAGNAAKAEQLRKARRAELIRKLRQLQRRAAGPKGQKGGGGGGAKMSRAEVGEPDVARIISAWTGGHCGIC